jgi:hypothetical protein
MHGLAIVMKAEMEPVVDKARAERRRFRRVQVNLGGRLFVPANNEETKCTVVDLSPGGASLDCELSLEADTPVVIYIDGFGRFEGVIVKRPIGGFGVKFNCTQMKRERVAEQLTLFLNKSLVSEADLRRHDRTPAKGFSRFTRADGEIVKCEVLDLSVSGVSVKTDIRPAIGEFVLIGQLAGRIARHHENGIGIEFVGLNASERADTARLKASISVVR